VVRTLPILGTLLLGLGVCAGCRATDRATDEREVATLLDVRFLEGRLTNTRTWSACTPSTTLATASCDGDTTVTAFVRAAASSAQLTSRLGRDTAAESRYLRALVDLRWYGSAPAALDRAVGTLDRLAHERPRDTRALNDLAVALVARAARDSAMLPLLRALDLLDSALAIEATARAAAPYAAAPPAAAARAARFNRALVLERLYLVESARQAWIQVARSEPGTAWGREAAQRAARLTRLSANGAHGPAPRYARERVLPVLGHWARSVLSDDTPGARTALQEARDALRRDTAGVDWTTPAAVAQAGAAATAIDRRALAAGYLALAEGHRQFAASEYERAIPWLTAAADRLRTRRSPLAGWATVYLAFAEIAAGRYGDADRRLSAVLADSASTEPTLAARVRLTLGVSAVRQGRYERALTLYESARPYVAHVGDQEFRGYAAYLRAEALALAGQTAASQDAALGALAVLAPFRASNYLNNQLAAIADEARVEGLRYAALDVTSELLHVAVAVGRPDVMALVVGARARDLAALGRVAAADSDLATADRWAARLPAGRSFDRIRAAVWLARGAVTRPREPRRALPLLGAAARVFGAFAADGYFVSAQYERALAALDAGDTASARRSLHDAVTAGERQASAFLAAGGRASFAETIEHAFDRLIALELDAGNADAAFAQLERARLAAWRRGSARHMTVSSPRTVGRALPANVLVADFALLGDRLAVWTMAHGVTRVRVVHVSRDSIAALVGRALDEARLDPRADVGRPASAALYDLLWRPLQQDLPDAKRVIVIPDRELHRLPFAALWDRSRRRFAIELQEISLAPTAAYVLGAPQHTTSHLDGGLALVIGDPALDDAAGASLGRLPGASAEAADVARLHARAKLLSAHAATVAAVTQWLPQASVLHFAGHAVLDPMRPELSYLALAPGDGTNGRLHAWEIGNLRLSNIRVIVLSACGTQNARSSRAGGVAGLAYSFLGAGAPSIVGTLWSVDDLATHSLVVALHRQLAAGVSPARALRDAQLQALQSADPYARSPVVWAAFTSTGY
jgi:CHAT domain-containing protein